MSRRKTHEKFIQEIKDKYSDEYEVIGIYINNKTKIKVKHNKCGYEWKIRPYHFLDNHGCPKCAGNLKKTTKGFKKEVFKKYCGEYEVLGDYINSNTKIKVRHNSNTCTHHEWEIKPNDLLRGHGCPVCSNQKAKLGVNTIWDTDRWMCDLGVSEEDAKRLFRGSNKKITVKCPDCGREKIVRISSIYNYKSICCSCGDGKSYPEKFVCSLLEQLNLDFETEYNPDWIENKRYDFYIPSLNCILETHGEQHYKQSFKRLGSRTLKEERINDKFKREISLANGIKYYIELDCRKSNIDYIKKSIFNSKLSQLFDLNNINWTRCAEFASKNNVKEVCDYWNNKKEYETTRDLSEKFKLSQATIINYIKKGTKLGWCNYNSKEEIKRIGKQNGKLIGKTVEIFKDGQSLGIFDSCSELDRKSEYKFGEKLRFSMIASVCRGERNTYKGYQFKYIENGA
ncbi:MAG: hypothetical protein E7H33_09815 [Clostridium perfringens]|nr:hypothetical protein [Clostridium perfringens]